MSSAGDAEREVVLRVFCELGLPDFCELDLRGFLGRVRVERSPETRDVGVGVPLSRGVRRREVRLVGRVRIMLLLERRRKMIS